MRVALRRDRLLAALTLLVGAVVALATPFALKSGAEFFLPVTAALVIAVALVPVLECQERTRIPSPLAALVCVLLFLIAANLPLAAHCVPASDFLLSLHDWSGRIQSQVPLMTSLNDQPPHY